MKEEGVSQIGEGSLNAGRKSIKRFVCEIFHKVFVSLRPLDAQRRTMTHARFAQDAETQRKKKFGPQIGQKNA
ncbi:MAG: hypothetical protein ACFCU3_09520 [Verrucomicrobiales bacterium]